MGINTKPRYPFYVSINMNSDISDTNTDSNNNHRSFFLIRLLLALVFLGISVGLVAIVKLALKQLNIFDLVYIRALYVVIMISLVYLGYHLYFRWFEKQKPFEFSRDRFWQELFIGMGIGTGLVTIIVIFLWIVGSYTITGYQFSSLTIMFLLMNIVIGFLEELFTRGIIFRLLEEGIGSWLALIVCAFEVGITHATNPGANTFSTLAVSLEFGVMLTLLYLITRRLWLIIGFHFAWNFTMGGIYGITVSGVETTGLLKSALNGRHLLTGGAFGIEASLPAICLCSIISLVLTIYIIKNKLYRFPMWHSSK